MLKLALSVLVGFALPAPAAETNAEFAAGLTKALAAYTQELVREGEQYNTAAQAARDLKSCKQRFLPAEQTQKCGRYFVEFKLTLIELK